MCLIILCRPIVHKEADFAHMSKDDMREKDAAMAKRAMKGKKKAEVEEQNFNPLNNITQPRETKTGQRPS